MLRTIKSSLLVGAAALAVVMLANPARAETELTDVQLYAQCAQVYHSEACRCAMGSASASVPASLPAAGQPLQVAAGNAGFVAGRVEPIRMPARITHDFVHRVQACMSQGSDAPAD